jgi:tape measure domain-containing protein
VAVTLEELEIFLGVKDDLQSAYQRVDQFASKTEARFKGVQSTMDRAMGKDLLLTYKVNDDALTAANKHLESKRTHMKEVQQWMNQNPLTYKVDLSELKAARAEVLGLKADMRSLSSNLNQQGRITVEYSIDASKFIDKFEKAGDKIAEKIGKTTVRTGGGGLLGGLMSIPGAIVQGIGIQVGERISRGFSKSADASLEAFGRGLDKQINRAMQTMTIGLARAGGYSSARDFRRDASQTVDNLTNFSPQRVRRAVKKLEDDLVDVLESAVVDNDPAAVQAKLRRIQKEMLEQPVQAAMNTAGAAIRIGAQPFRIRKRVELSRTVKEAEGMVDEILQNMSDELKDQIKKAKGVTLATGGIDYQKGGENTYFSANLVRKLTPGNVTIPVPNSYSNDPSTLGGLYKARQAIFPGAPMPVDRLLQTSVETGRNPDAARMLAQAMAVRKIAPDTPITVTGSSGGAALVEEVIGAAERAAMKKIKGVGLTMPGFDLTRTASKANYKTLVGSYDPVAIGAFGNRYNDQSRYFNKAMGAAPFNPTGMLAPGQSTSVFAGLGTGHHLADFLSDPKVQQKFQSFTGTGNIDPGYTGDRKNFGFAGQLYSESQSIPRTIGVILGDLKALSEVAKGEYSFIDPGNPSYRRDNDFAAMSGNFEKLKVSGADAPEYEKFLAWLKTFKRELTAFYEMAGTHEGMMPKGLTDAAKQGQQFFKFREGVSQPEYFRGYQAINGYAPNSQKNGFSVGQYGGGSGGVNYSPSSPLAISFEPTKTEKVLELATNTVNKVSQSLEAIAPIGEAATNVLNDVARGLTNIAGGQVQKRVDQLRGSDSALAVQGDASQRGSMVEFGKIAAKDIETTKQAALRATEQFVKFADGTIKAGKAARDFFQGLRSQGRTIQDLGDAVVEVSAELVDEFDGLGGTGAADIKLLTSSMAALKGEIDSLPPLLPSAEINESEKKTQELVQTAYSLYEVWDKLSKESQTISLAQGGVFDIASLQKSLNIIEEIEVALAKSRYVTGHTYDQGMGGLVSQVRDVQAPLGRLKGGAYRGIKDNLSQVKEAAAAGDDTAQGFINGIEGKLNAIDKVANDAGKKLILEMKSILGIASPSKVFIQIGKDVVAGFEIGLENLDDVFLESLKALNNAIDTGKIKDFSLGDVDRVSDTIKAQVKGGNQNIRVNQFGKILEDEKPKVQKTSREIGFEIGSKTKEGIDKASPIVKDAITALSDGIINQLRIVAPGITGFIEGIGLDLNKLKSLGGAGLTIGAVAVGIGLFGGKILEVANNTADAATEQNRFKRVLDQTVAGGGAAYYGRLAAEANKYGVNLQAAAKSAVALETSLVNRPLAGQGVQILSGFQAQFASQGTPVADQERSLAGVEQAIRKNKLQAEELYQIIEPLPGAMEAMAAAAGKTTAELFRATSQGEVFTEDIIQQFSDQLKIQSGLSGGADTAEASMGRLANQSGILAANVGQLSVVARKAGTDVLGAGLEGVNKNAELFNITLLALTASMAIGLVSATVSAGRQLMGLAAVQKIVSASSATMSAGIGTLTRSFLPLAAAIAAVEVIRFGWDLTQPSDDVKKLSEDLDKLLQKTRQFNKERDPNYKPEQSLDDLNRKSTGASSGRVRFFSDLFDNLKAQSDSAGFDKNIRSANEINDSQKVFLDSLVNSKDELEKINKLQENIAKLKGLSAVSANSGDTAKVADINKELVELQRRLNKNPLVVDIQNKKGDLTKEIKSLDSQIEGLRSQDILSPEALDRLGQLELARSNAQNLYNELQKVNGLTLQPLQSINAATKTAVLSAQKDYEDSQSVIQKNRAELTRLFGGPGAADSQTLAIESAKLKVTDLKTNAEKLTKQLEAQSKGIKEAKEKLNPQALQDFTTALSSLGVTFETATAGQFDEAIAILSAGGKDPSGTVKKFTDEQLKARRTTKEQIIQNTADVVQAEQDIRKSELDKQNAIVDYARQVEQSNYDLQKSIEDNQRALKRQFEDTIQETKQLFSDLAKIKLRNDLNSKIQTISGDFSDTVLSSLQSYFDKIAEVMDAKLAAAGVKTGLTRKLEDLDLGQRDFNRGVFNQQQGIDDAAAGQSGSGKVFTPFNQSSERELANLALTVLQESSGLRNQIDVGVSIINRLASGKYGKSLTDVVFAPGQYEPNFGKSPVNSINEAASRLGGGSAKQEIMTFLNAITNPSAAKEAQSFLKGATDFRGQSLLGNMRSGDPYRGNSGANFFLQESQSQAVAQKALSILLGGGSDFKQSQQVSAPPPSIPSGTKFLLPLDHLPPGYRLPDQSGDNVYGAEGRERNFTTPFAEALKSVLQQAGFSAKVLKPESFGSYSEYDRALKQESQGAQTIAIHTLFDQYLGRENFVRVKPGDDGDAALGKKVANALGALGGKFGGFDTESNQTVNMTGQNPGVLVELGIIKALESKFNPDQAAKIFGAKLIQQFGGTAKSGNQLAVPYLPGKSSGALPPPPPGGLSTGATLPTAPDEQNIVNAINEQFSAQNQLSAEKQRALRIDADKMLRDFKNQVETKNAEFFGQQIGIGSQIKQRRLDLLPQTPVIGAISQLNSKQSADAQEIVKQKTQAASLLRDIDNIPKIIEAARKNGVDTKGLEELQRQTIGTRAALVEFNKTIADTNPIKTFTRDLRIATDAQLGQADSLAGQLDAVNALLNSTGTAPTGGAARAAEAQFRAAREQLQQFNDATDATLAELEAKAKDFEAAGDTGRATVTRDAAKALKASADEFNYSGLALTDGAKAIATANASLDEAFKKSLELRKPRDQFEAASQGLADKQAQLLDASGDSFGANSIKRDLQVARERKTLTDEIKANELEINKLQNRGDTDSLNAADQLYATNAAIEAQIALLEKLATVSYPSVASSLKLSIADAGSQAFGTLANAIADGNINIQTLSDIFKQAGQSIIQTVIEIGQQFIKNQIFNLLGGILGAGLPKLSGGGINAAFPLTFPNLALGGRIPNYANGEGYTIPAIAAAMNRERMQSGGLEPRLVVANTKERILNPKETMLWETIAKYGFRNENYAMGGTTGGGRYMDGSSLSTRSSSSNSFGDFIFNGGGSMSPEEAVQLRKDVAGFIDKRIQDTEIQRRRSGK